MAGKDRSELIRSEEFHRYLQQFDSKPQISAVGLIFPGRGLAASNLVFPLPTIDLGLPNYLRVDRDGKESILSGQRYPERLRRHPNSASFGLIELLARTRGLALSLSRLSYPTSSDITEQSST